MRKNFYKLIASLALTLIAYASWAQVNITYQVDITNYLSGGATLDPTGMRVAGDFGNNAAMNNGVPMASWAPTDAGSAMTDMGSNVWSITVTYSDTAIGNRQNFKFVNGNWGSGLDEGDGGIDTFFVTEGCGANDGSNNYNRFVYVPGSDLVLQYCWSHCTKCDGSSAVISGIQNVNGNLGSFDVYPTLVSNSAEVNYVVAKGGKLNVTVRSFTGQVVETLVNGQTSAGEYKLNLNTDDYANGMYVVTISLNGDTFNQRFIVNH